LRAKRTLVSGIVWINNRFALENKLFYIGLV